MQTLELNRVQSQEQINKRFVPDCLVLMRLDCPSSEYEAWSLHEVLRLCDSVVGTCNQLYAFSLKGCKSKKLKLLSLAS